MKEFVLLIKEGDGPRMTEKESSEMRDSYIKWMDQLISKDQYVHGNRLTESRVTLESGSEIISDGPFVEPKEIIGGIVIIRAENMEAALKLVETCPMHHTLDIEVRESKHVYSG